MVLTLLTHQHPDSKTKKGVNNARTHVYLGVDPIKCIEAKGQLSHFFTGTTSVSILLQRLFKIPLIDCYGKQSPLC